MEPSPATLTIEVEWHRVWFSYFLRGVIKSLEVHGMNHRPVIERIYHHRRRRDLRIFSPSVLHGVLVEIVGEGMFKMECRGRLGRWYVSQ